MDSKTMDRFFWFGWIGTIAFIPVIMVALMTEGRPLGFLKAGIYLIGVTMGLLISIGVGRFEIKRFERELKQAKEQQSTQPVRLPLSLRTTDIQELRQMWGEDYPESWEREEEEE